VYQRFKLKSMLLEKIKKYELVIAAKFERPAVIETTLTLESNSFAPNNCDAKGDGEDR
jgi:hypothetical protein